MILSSVAPAGDGSSAAAGICSPSTVGSGLGSAQRGDGGLGSGPGVVLVDGSLPRSRTVSSVQHSQTPLEQQAG